MTTRSPYDAFRHRTPLRVRWAEVDAQGVVFNGHYLLYCDVAITEYWRAIGLRYPDDLLARGSDLFVRKATVEYRAPIRYDDELEACARVASLGRSSLRFAVGLFRRGEREAACAEAELVYVNADPQARRAVPWPEDLRALIRAFEITPPEEPHGRAD